MKGVPSLDLHPGEYTIRPSEWRRDADAQLSNLTSGSEGAGEAMWHLFDVETARGETVLEVLDDRRAMDDGLSIDGRQFLVRTPDDEPVMAFERDGFTVGTTTTLVSIPAGETLGEWAMTSRFRYHWELRDETGTATLRAKRQWSLRNLFYPTYRFTSDDGRTVGHLDVRQERLFYEADLDLERSSVPPEVTLAFACGIFWSATET